jgi:hypothetical protein
MRPLSGARCAVLQTCANTACKFKTKQRAAIRAVLTGLLVVLLKKNELTNKQAKLKSIEINGLTT